MEQATIGVENEKKMETQNATGRFHTEVMFDANGVFQYDMDRKIKEFTDKGMDLVSVAPLTFKVINDVYRCNTMVFIFRK